MQLPGIQLGWTFNSYSYAATLALSSATTYISFSFVPYEDNMQVSSFTAYVSAITGSPTGITAIICGTNASFNPDVSNPVQSATVNIGAADWTTWSFGAPATLTKGLLYFVVIQGNSTSAYPTIQYMNQGMPYDRMGVALLGDFGKKQTSDAGSSWVNNSVGFGFDIAFSNGAHYGYAYRTYNYLLSTAGTEAGVRLTIPQTMAPMQVAQISFTLRRTGSSDPGPSLAKIYENGSLIATSDSYNYSTYLINTSNRKVFNFSPAVILHPGATVDITTTAGASASGTNYYRLEGLGSLLPGYPNQIPFGAISSFRSASGVWTTDTASFQFFSLGLTPGNEFVAPPINRRTSSGR